MKSLIILPIILLCACVGGGAYDNERVRSECAIGYHEDYSYALVLFKTKDKDKDEDKGKDKTSKYTEDFRCKPDLDKDKFIQHHNQN